MSFPTTGILDNFNRANESPISDGGKWSYQALSNASGTGFAVVTQQLVPSTAHTYDGIYWSAEQFGPDVEVYVDLVTDWAASDELAFLLARLTNPHTNTPSGYGLSINRAGGSFDFYRIDAGAQTLLSSVTHAIAAGDAVGFAIIGDELQAWHKPAAGAWTLIGSHADATHAGAGYIGLETHTHATPTPTFDNLGGGTVVVAPATTHTGPFAAAMRMSAAFSGHAGAPRSGPFAAVLRQVAAFAGHTGTIHTGPLAGILRQAATFAGRPGPVRSGPFAAVMRMASEIISELNVPHTGPFVTVMRQVASLAGHSGAVRSGPFAKAMRQTATFSGHVPPARSGPFAATLRMTSAFAGHARIPVHTGPFATTMRQTATVSGHVGAMHSGPLAGTLRQTATYTGRALPIHTGPFAVTFRQTAVFSGHSGTPTTGPFAATMRMTATFSGDAGPTHTGPFPATLRMDASFTGHARVPVGSGAFQTVTGRIAVGSNGRIRTLRTVS